MNHELRWQRSRDCADHTCVEVAITDDSVLVRNSTSPDDIARFTAEEWRVFLRGVFQGQFQV
jgi:hypothetical protein